MAFDKNNIGKDCSINISEDTGVEDKVLGTIIGYYVDTIDEYYIVSLVPDGKVVNITDDGSVTIIDSGGGSSVTVEALTATENKTYNAPADKAYSPVTVDVKTYENEFKGLIDRTIVSAKIPAGADKIGSSAFVSCTQMISCTIPESVLSLEPYAFSGCTSLLELELPASVGAIKNVSCQNLTSLQKLTFNRTTPASVLNANAFGNLPTTCVIHVPYGADHSILAAYQSATNYPDPNTYTYVEDMP